MNKINTYHDLLEEKRNLEISLQTQKSIIVRDLNEFKEEYSPAINLLSSLNKITNRDISNPIIKMGINIAGEFFQKNMPLVGGNRMVQFSIPFIAKKAITFALSKGILQFFKIRERWKANAAAK